MAIQLVINRELGLRFCENPWQGSFIVEELTAPVEEAVYQEFERISERGAVLGAMDTMYQRAKIQDESLYYESRKHDGSLFAELMGAVKVCSLGQVSGALYGVGGISRRNMRGGQGAT